MTTLIFVHGTGVRGKALDAYEDRIRQGLSRSGASVVLEVCDWGSVVGAELSRGGASIPDGVSSRAVEEVEIDDDELDASLWATLDRDPFALIWPLGTMREELLPGEPSTIEALGLFKQNLAASLPVREFLRHLNLDEYLSDAARDTLSNPALRSMILDARNTDVLDAVAHAVVARLLQISDRDLGIPTPTSRTELDHLVDLMVGATATTSARGAGTRLLGRTALYAWAATAARPVERRRRAITDALTPMAGDVLRYLSHGNLMRDCLRAHISNAKTPVVLLGHSLGGVISLELLCEAEPPSVAGLVTFGSQAPYLYELGSLQVLDGELPTTLPVWRNVYDRRDLLAFVGQPIFGAQVIDVEVSNGLAFPRSHSGYVSNPELFSVVGQVLAGR